MKELYSPLQNEWDALVAVWQAIIDRHVARLSSSVYELEDSEQQAFVDRITPYLEFELSQSSISKGSRHKFTGHGLLLITEDDTVLGGEVVSHGDVITGTLRGVQAYPVPTTHCLLDALNGDNIPVYDQTVAAVVLLDDGVYRTGLMSTGKFEVEHRLDCFTLGVPLTLGISSELLGE